MIKSFQDQTLLVTGASGFIGSHLTKRLLDFGARVHIIVRGKSDLWRLESIPKKKLKIWHVDLNDLRGLSEALRNIRPKWVFHLGASVNSERKFALLNEMVDVNIKGTLNLVTSLLDSPCVSIVNFGTCEEYGNLKAPFLETERESPVSPYSASKLAATHFCQMIYRTKGLPIVTVRPFLTYGPHQISNMLIPSLIRHCLEGQKEFLMTSGEQTREFNFVDDIVDSVLNVSLRPELTGEIINIGNGQEFKVLDVAQLIVQLTGSSLKLNVGRLPYREGEAFHFYSSTNKYSQYFTPFSYTPLEKGLEKTIRWYNDYMKNK